MAYYFSFDLCRNEFANITEMPWFQEEVKNIVKWKVPWNDMNNIWWRELCRIDNVSKDELQSYLIKCKSFDEAWIYLKEYPFPYLSPIEHSDDYPGDTDVLKCMEDQKRILMKCNSSLDPEWYTSLHNCQILNGICVHR